MTMRQVETPVGYQRPRGWSRSIGRETRADSRSFQFLRVNLERTMFTVPARWRFWVRHRKLNAMNIVVRVARAAESPLATRVRGLIVADCERGTGLTRSLNASFR